MTPTSSQCVEVAIELEIRPDDQPPNASRIEVDIAGNKIVRRAFGSLQTAIVESVSNVQQAREDLGARLRELRTAADLNGRELAVRLGWDNTKVSPVEHGRQIPTEHDIRAWCAATSADLHVRDLIAAVRNLNAAHLEYRRLTSKTAQTRTAQLEANSMRIRGYDPTGTRTVANHPLRSSRHKGPASSSWTVEKTSTPR